MYRILFVDDEPEILRGLRRMLIRRQAEWKMDFANSGAEALEMLAKEEYSAVVSDVRMPGMDGPELLSRVRETYPGVVRIALSGQADQDSSLRALEATHRFISKPCEPNQLDSVLQAALALQPLVANSALRSIVNSVAVLPVVPETYAKMSAELDSPDPSIQNLGEILSRDVGLSAKIMQVTSSAFFGLARPVTSPQEALKYLGVDTLRALTLALQAFDDSGSKGGRSSALGFLMEHGFRVAQIAREIATSEGAPAAKRGYAFSAGLMHDIGKLILLRAAEERYLGCLSRASKDEWPLYSAEAREFGVSHAEVGGYLLGTWGLRPELFLTVAHHHTLPAEASAERDALGDLPLWVRVADLIDHIEWETGMAQGAEAELDGLIKSPQGERVGRWWKARLEKTSKGEAA